jgi:23S rRNA (uracil-5-)-methyltransferase RumA
LESGDLMEPLLKKDQQVLLTIKRLGINGEGIGYYKKQAVFVPGVLPPEEAIVKITEVTERYSRGELVRLNIKAKKRVKPFCKHFDECGGCQIQHIAYTEQLSLKEEMLIQAIDRYSGLDTSKIKFNDIVGMNNPRYYRHKSQMPVRNTKFGITTGLYKPNSNDLVPIIDCPVHAENINIVNRKIIEICDKHEIHAFDSKTMRGLLRYIVIRESHFNGEIQVTLVITIFNKALHKAANEIIRISGVESVGISKNRDASNVEVFGEEVEILAGKNTITEGIGNIKYDLKPKAFYQLNPSQAVKLYKIVKDNIDFETEKTIVDAYCGAGAISMYIAPYAEKIVGIDISKESVYSALHNRKVNKFANVDFVHGEVKSALPKLYNEGLNPDVIIFDPPRSGIDYKTLDLLTRKVVKKIIYVSCNPSTLAKNLKVLTKKYTVKSVTPFDMFPHTSHIESITILEKK